MLLSDIGRLPVEQGVEEQGDLKFHVRPVCLKYVGFQSVLFKPQNSHFFHVAFLKYSLLKINKMRSIGILHYA